MLIGAFAGAPVLARELEAGTSRFAWTQGIGRWRWTLAKLVLLAAVVTAIAGAFSVLSSSYNQPFFASGYAIPFATRVFGLGEVAFAAWTLAAFSIGALAGMLIRRIVPAIAATLAAYAGLALATALYLRQHYMTPLLTSHPNLPGSAWSVTSGTPRAASSRSPPRAPSWSRPSRGSASPRIDLSQVGRVFVPPCCSPAQCLTQHGYTEWTGYQPGSRFWPFQLIEGGWLLVLSVLFIAVTVWLVRRRAA